MYFSCLESFLYNCFHDKIKYLTDGFELIDSIFKLYMNIKFLSEIERIEINEYYNIFLDIKKRIILSSLQKFY